MKMTLLNLFQSMSSQAYPCVALRPYKIIPVSGFWNTITNILYGCVEPGQN